MTSYPKVLRPRARGGCQRYLSNGFIFAAKLFLTVLDEYICYYHKYSSLEEHDGKDGPQESTKENTSLTNEAA